MTRQPLLASPGPSRFVRLVPRSATSRATGRATSNDGEDTDRAGHEDEARTLTAPFVERRRGVRGALTGVLSLTRCAWRVADARSRRGD